MNSTFIILGIVVLFVLYIIVLFNGLVRLRNRVGEAWSDIDVQLKRRYDLIPNLINTVKGYAAHESGVFEKVTAARASAMQAGKAADKAQAENMLSETLKSLFAVAEAYPDLKANQNFLELQSELSDTENMYWNSTIKLMCFRAMSSRECLILPSGNFLKSLTVRKRRSRWSFSYGDTL
jgi:LemA protein